MGKQLFLQGARPGSSSSRGLAAQGCFLALPSSLSLLSGRSLTHQGSYLLQGRCPAMQRPALSLSHSTHLLPRGAVILAVLHERLIFWPVYSVFDLQTILLVYVTDTSRPRIGLVLGLHKACAQFMTRNTSFLRRAGVWLPLKLEGMATPLHRLGCPSLDTYIRMWTQHITWLTCSQTDSLQQTCQLISQT